MVIGDLRAFVGEWELKVDLPGADDVRGRVFFDLMGEVLIQRTSVPLPEAPDSCCVVVAYEGAFRQHYFDSRGTARVYAMAFDGRRWTLERTSPDFTPLDFQQRFIGTFSDDFSAITAEWQSSTDGRQWNRDFGMTCRRTGGETQP